MNLWTDDGRTMDDGRTTDGWTPDHGHPISSPCEPNGSGELKNELITFHSNPFLCAIYPCFKMPQDQKYV